MSAIRAFGRGIRDGESLMPGMITTRANTSECSFADMMHGDADAPWMKVDFDAASSPPLSPIHQRFRYSMPKAMRRAGHDFDAR